MILTFPYSEMVTMLQTDCCHFSVVEKGEAKEVILSREAHVRTGEAECATLHPGET